jgi:hypothetical protein
MPDPRSKEAVFAHFRDRQAARRVAITEERALETAEAIRASEVETVMTVEEGLAFLRAGGEREDAA